MSLITLPMYCTWLLSGWSCHKLLYLSILCTRFKVVISYCTLVLCIDYHLVHKIWLAIQICSSQGPTEIETPVGGYDQEEGSRDSTEPCLTSPVSWLITATNFLIDYCDVIPRSTVLKQPSHQVLTTLHVFPLSSASKWYHIPLYQEPFGSHTYKHKSCLHSSIPVHEHAAGHQNGHRNYCDVMCNRSILTCHQEIMILRSAPTRSLR